MDQQNIRFEGRTVYVEGEAFVRGQASGDDNNCLIDTLRQALDLTTVRCDNVRQALQREFSAQDEAHVSATNYLILDLHWWHVLLFLGREAVTQGLIQEPLDPDCFRIIAVDFWHRGSGDVVPLEDTSPREHTLHLSLIHI